MYYIYMNEQQYTVGSVPNRVIQTRYQNNTGCFLSSQLTGTTLGSYF